MQAGLPSSLQSLCGLRLVLGLALGTEDLLVCMDLISYGMR